MPSLYTERYLRLTGLRCVELHHDLGKTDSEFQTPWDVEVGKDQPLIFSTERVEAILGTIDKTDASLCFTPQAASLIMLADRVIPRCPTAKQIMAFAYGKTQTSSASNMQWHIEHCAPCRNRVKCVQEFKLTMHEFFWEGLDPCPDPEILALYIVDRSDEPTQRSLRLHSIFCDECFMILHTAEPLAET